MRIVEVHETVFNCRSSGEGDDDKGRFVTKMVKSLGLLKFDE